MLNWNKHIIVLYMIDWFIVTVNAIPLILIMSARIATPSIPLYGGDLDWNWRGMGAGCRGVKNCLVGGELVYFWSKTNETILGQHLFTPMCIHAEFP